MPLEPSSNRDDERRPLWSIGARTELGVEVWDVETETGFFNAAVTFWIGGVATEVHETLSGFWITLADVYRRDGQRTFTFPLDWSVTSIAEHFVNLYRSDRTDAEDALLFDHIALPTYDSSRDRAAFIVRSGTRDLLVLTDLRTAAPLASTNLPAHRFAEVLREFLTWIDERLPPQRDPADTRAEHGEGTSGGSTCAAAIDEFRRLVREAQDADLGEEPVEPHLVRLLTTIKSQPECRSEYVAAFKDLVESRASIPWELIPFCMHELRWAEVRTTIEDRHAEARTRNDWRAIAVLSKYLDAFRDDWESIDLFTYYTAR
jgi:hypothetical protein